jgi:hypothetical protein
LSTTTQRIVREQGSKSREVQVNEVITHPLSESASGNGRSRWKYRFLRVTRWPTPDRPDSGRILVENEVTGKRTEFYAMLFGLKFKERE